MAHHGPFSSMIYLAFNMVMFHTKLLHSQFLMNIVGSLATNITITSAQSTMHFRLWRSTCQSQVSNQADLAAPPHTLNQGLQVGSQ